jgi:integrase
MGRPPLAVGTYGHILIRQVGNQYEARCRFRDFDGATRQVRAFGRSKSAAEQRLKKALTERGEMGSDEITPDTRLAKLTDLWLLDLAESSEHSAGTKRIYELCATNYIKPALGQLRVREITVRRLDLCLRTVNAKHGPGSAKTTRTALSGILGLAVRYGALATNPMRSTRRISAPKKPRARALTTEQAELISDRARSDTFAVEHDLGDLIDWMLATGCRIGEAIAVREAPNDDGDPVLDLTAGTWEVNALIERVRGQGLVLQHRTKTDAGWRILALPPFAVAMIRRRGTEARFHRNPHRVIFTSPDGKLRDPSNTSGDLRRFLDSIDCEHCEHRGWTWQAEDGRKLRQVRCDRGPYSWVTSHTFRKTVATRMEEAGFTPRQVADQLGHEKPSMTMDVYFGRNVVNAEVAKLLDR